MLELLKDPAGLLERAPELRRLAQADASVRRALGRGNPHAVYRALWWARLLGRLKHHRKVLDSLLAHRRLFATPLRRMPVLTTVNGMGASVYGTSDRDADGSYFKTHFLVFVFIPLVPLSQYLVKDGSEGGGAKSSWYFLAKVPMSTPLRLWNRLVVAGVLLAVAAGAARAFHASRHHEVHVVNGLPGPVHVTIGSVAYDVPANQRRTASVPTGTHPVKVTTPAGRPIESGELRVVAGTELLAWNVLGAAPIYERTILYGSGNMSPQEAASARPRYHCGELAVHMTSVDFAFRDPPRSVSLSSGQKVARRTQVGVDPRSLDVCTNILARAGKPGPALTLAHGLSGFDDPDAHLATAASALCTASGKPDEALLLAREALATHPDSVEHHRLYQGVAEDQGKVAELREEYRARYEAAPTSPDAGYLYARVLPNPEAFALGSRLVDKYPTHVPLHRLVIFGGVRRLQFADTLRYLERLRTLDQKEWRLFVEDHAVVLAGLGRADDADKLLKDAFNASDESTRYRIAGLCSWLGAARGSAGEELLLKLGKPGPGDLLRFRVRFWNTAADADLRSLGADPEKRMYALMQHAHFDPGSALNDAAAMRSEDLTELDGPVLVLLLGESIRSGHAAARARLEAAASRVGVPVPQVQAYLEQGQWSDPVDQLTLQHHGALHLARSRASGLAPGERERLRDLAARSDPLGGYAHKAVEAWPAP
jgi:hypothetical protein